MTFTIISRRQIVENPMALMSRYPPDNQPGSMIHPHAQAPQSHHHPGSPWLTTHENLGNYHQPMNSIMGGGGGNAGPAANSVGHRGNVPPTNNGAVSPVMPSGVQVASPSTTSFVNSPPPPPQHNHPLGSPSSAPETPPPAYSPFDEHKYSDQLQLQHTSTDSSSQLARGAPVQHHPPGSGGVSGVVQAPHMMGDNAMDTSNNANNNITNQQMVDNPDIAYQEPQFWCRCESFPLFSEILDRIGLQL